MPRKRILIVEDRKADAAHLARECEERGMDASCTGKLGDALLFVAQNHVDLILLDANLEDASAMETLDSLHKFGDIPLIVITAAEDLDLIERCGKEGVGIEFKPFKDINALFGTALKRMNRKEPSREISAAIVQEHHRATADKVTVTDKPLWIFRWQPVVMMCTTLMVASISGGAFLYRSIAEKATQTQENVAHFTAIDSALKIHEGELKGARTSISDLDKAAQTSREDRAVIHREIENVRILNDQRMNEIKQDIVARLNRIEDKLDRTNK